MKVPRQQHFPRTLNPGRRSKLYKSQPASGRQLSITRALAAPSPGSAVPTPQSPCLPLSRTRPGLPCPMREAQHHAPRQILALLGPIYDHICRPQCKAPVKVPRRRFSHPHGPFDHVYLLNPDHYPKRPLFSVTGTPKIGHCTATLAVIGNARPPNQCG